MCELKYAGRRVAALKGTEFTMPAAFVRHASALGLEALASAAKLGCEIRLARALILLMFFVAVLLT